MESRGRAETKHPDPPKEKIILIGNPNVGKSVIFNYLTGKYVTVSNYPGTTVEVAFGTISVHGKKFQVVDTPGVNSLIPMSEDEKVTRDILLRETQPHLVQIIDAKNLRRGLLISLQLLEMKLPFLIVLNMWDEAKSRGVEIRTQTLSKSLGAPILKTVATRKIGLEKIRDNLQTHPPSTISITYPDAIELGVSRIAPLLPMAPISKRSLALMLLSGDESLAEWLHKNLSEGEILQIEKILQEIQNRFAEPIGYLINQARLRKADELLSQVMEMKREAPKTLSTFLGNLAIHPLWGIPILLFVLWITYEFVGVFGAQISVNFLEKTLFGRWLLPPITTCAALHSHLNSTGVSRRPLWSLHHGHHLCHCDRLAHCWLFLPHLRTDGGFRISAQTGGDDQSDLQKDGVEWQSGLAYGLRARM